MNAILHADRSIKNQCTVPLHIAADPACGLHPHFDEAAGDIFIYNAPEIPESMISPMLPTDWEQIVEKLKANGMPESDAWVETAPQAVIDAIQAEQALARCIAQRLVRYRTESDPLRLSIEYDAHIAGVTPDYTPWFDLVAQIKADIPKP